VDVERRQADGAVEVEDVDLLGIRGLGDDGPEEAPQAGLGGGPVGGIGRVVEERPGVVTDTGQRPDEDDVPALLVDPAVERVGLDPGDRVEPVVQRIRQVAGRPDVGDRPDGDDGDR
jgi:hypothetical protein